MPSYHYEVRFHSKPFDAERWDEVSVLHSGALLCYNISDSIREGYNVAVDETWYPANSWKMVLRKRQDG